MEGAGYEYVAASRHALSVPETTWKQSPNLSGSADWRRALEGVDAVVHLAGRVHIGREGDSSAYFVENHEGTVKLAQDAIAAGASRFLFMSTAKVLGDESGRSAFLETTEARPSDPYAASKLAAELALGGMSDAIQVTILRPPLVYGPEVKANFLALISAVSRGLPLPLASVKNRRSLIGVSNLASSIVACLDSPKAAGRTYHVTDGCAVSTPDLVRAIATALGKPSRLFPFPARLLEACGAAIGRTETIRRLTRSLELDDRSIRVELGWRPIRTMEDELADTARWYERLYGK